MAPTRFQLSIMVAVASCWWGTSLAARSYAPSQAPAIPAPSSDPAPGPFLAILGEDGALVDVGVAAQAMRSWGGPKHAAFVLCFQPASGPVDWTLVLRGLNSVSRELSARGAAVVVIDVARVCASPPSPSVRGKPHVEIMGVLRSAD